MTASDGHGVSRRTTLGGDRAFENRQDGAVRIHVEDELGSFHGPVHEWRADLEAPANAADEVDDAAHHVDPGPGRSIFLLDPEGDRRVLVESEHRAAPEADDRAAPVVDLDRIA